MVAVMFWHMGYGRRGGDVYWNGHLNGSQFEAIYISKIIHCMKIKIDDFTVKINENSLRKIKI